mgnify:CR=1 FL=1
MSLEPSRTFHANQAVQLSDLVALKFNDARFGTGTPRVLKVSNPDGPSTDGGLKARQSIVLVHEGSDTNAGAIVVGWLDVSRRSAELRPYASVNQQQQARFGTQLDVSKLEYERCVADLHDFFRTQGIDSRVQVATPPTRRSMAPTPSVAPPGAFPIQMVGIGLGCFVAGFVVCYALFASGVVH